MKIQDLKFINKSAEQSFMRALSMQYAMARRPDGFFESSKLSPVQQIQVIYSENAEFYEYNESDDDYTCYVFSKRLLPETKEDALREYRKIAGLLGFRVKVETEHTNEFVWAEEYKDKCYSVLQCDIGRIRWNSLIYQCLDPQFLESHKELVWVA